MKELAPRRLDNEVGKSSSGERQLLIAKQTRFEAANPSIARFSTQPVFIISFKIFSYL
ncbi:hypothetical protein JW851_00500 [Candidatus Woesearchaeota archaeon]|nr:hypothetical protein [Candidatus Woesearchaeota archaeon]